MSVLLVPVPRVVDGSLSLAAFLMLLFDLEKLVACVKAPMAWCRLRGNITLNIARYQAVLWRVAGAELEMRYWRREGE